MRQTHDLHIQSLPLPSRAIRKPANPPSTCQSTIHNSSNGRIPAAPGWRCFGACKSASFPTFLEVNTYNCSYLDRIRCLLLLCSSFGRAHVSPAMLLRATVQTNRIQKNFSDMTCRGIFLLTSITCGHCKLQLPVGISIGCRVADLKKPVECPQVQLLKNIFGCKVVGYIGTKPHVFTVLSASRST